MVQAEKKMKIEKLSWVEIGELLNNCPTDNVDYEGLKWLTRGLPVIWYLECKKAWVMRDDWDL